MKAIEDILKQPALVGFGNRAGALDIQPDGDSVLLAPARNLQAATAALAGVMTAADKAKLDALVNTGGTVGPTDFESRVQIAATSVTDPEIDYLRTAGYTSAGDGGAGLYRRTGIEPGHAGKIQSADGAWWELVRDGQNNNLQFGAFGGTERTTEFQNALDFVTGGTLHIVNDPSGSEYITDRLTPAADTLVSVEAGVVINCATGGLGVFAFLNSNVHVWGYGATTKSDGTQISHNIYIAQGAVNCSVRGLTIIGAGNTGDDCIYVGGDPANNNVPKNIQIIDCIADGNARARNCLSIVAADGVLVQGGVYTNALSAPGMGIDIEANEFMANGENAARNITIRGCEVHGNPTNAGIGMVFGSEVLIEDCDIHGNGGVGVLVTTGSAPIADYRKGDILGVKSFDLVDGWIDVTDGAAGNRLIDDLGIVEGMIVARATTSPGAWPTEYTTSTFWQVVAIDSTQARIKLGISWDVGVVIPTTAGSGTLDYDPAVSDLRLDVYGRAGQSDKVKIVRNRIWNNADDGIRLVKTRDVEVIGNRIDVVDETGINCQFSSLLRVVGNSVRLNAGSVALGTYGISFTGGADYWTDGNQIEGFTYSGLQAAGASRSSFGRDQIINCGTVGNVAYTLIDAFGARCSPVIRASEALNPTQGLRLLSGCTNCLVLGADCTGVGSNNANSISGGTGTVFRDCLQKDGTFKP